MTIDQYAAVIGYSVMTLSSFAAIAWLTYAVLNYVWKVLMASKMFFGVYRDYCIRRWKDPSDD